MPSLREIRQLGPVLIVDAASAVIQVGLLDGARADRWESSSAEAGIGLFQCLEKLQCDLGRVAAFVFCEGPGSILGIRTTAMAIRTWCMLNHRPVFSYCSLALVAHELKRAEVTVIADARRDSWHCYRLGEGLRRVAPSELSGELVTPESFRHWSALPRAAAKVPYVVGDLFTATPDVDILTPTPSPDAFLHEEPTYVTWTPAIHRASAAP